MVRKKIRKVGWKIASTSFEIASLRYRALYPALALSEQEIESRIFHFAAEEQLQDLDVLVIVKSFKSEDLLLAQRAAEKGVRVVFDLCDNIFINAYGGKAKNQILDTFLAIAPSIGKAISGDWNCLERFDHSTALLHYTDMDTQPWVSLANPLGGLWMKCLRRALEAGFISSTEVQREVAAGHVRPSLLSQLEFGLDDSRQLSKEARALDHGFIAPYKKLYAASARPWTSPLGLAKAMLRSALSKIRWLQGRSSY